MTELIVSLPDDVAERIADVAHARGVSPNDVAREAITVYVLATPIAHRRLSFAAVGHSGRGDLAEQAEDPLRAGFGS